MLAAIRGQELVKHIKVVVELRKHLGRRKVAPLVQHLAISVNPEVDLLVISHLIGIKVKIVKLGHIISLEDVVTHSVGIPHLNPDIEDAPIRKVISNLGMEAVSPFVRLLWFADAF